MIHRMRQAKRRYVKHILRAERRACADYERHRPVWILTWRGILRHYRPSWTYWRQWPWVMRLTGWRLRRWHHDGCQCGWCMDFDSYVLLNGGSGCEPPHWMHPRYKIPRFGMTFRP